jgi:hypothetical protein
LNAPLNELKNDLLILFELQRLYAEILYELEVVKAHHALYKTSNQTNNNNTNDTTTFRPQTDSINELPTTTTTTTTTTTNMDDELDLTSISFEDGENSLTEELSTKRSKRKSALTTTKRRIRTPRVRRRENRKVTHAVNEVDPSTSVSLASEGPLPNEMMHSSITMEESEEPPPKPSSPSSARISISNANTLSAVSMETEDINVETSQFISRHRSSTVLQQQKKLMEGDDNIDDFNSNEDEIREIDNQ